MPAPFSADHLNELGFSRAVSLHVTPRIETPTDGGVYVVTSSNRESRFMPVSVGGHFKRKDPSVELGRLEDSWIDEAEVLYIGRATNLKRRVNELRRFGQGDPVGHWGGRFLWQLGSLESLNLRWLVSADPAGLEAELIEEFADHFGALPFANLTQPRIPMAVG